MDVKWTFLKNFATRSFAILAECADSPITSNFKSRGASCTTVKLFHSHPTGFLKKVLEQFV